MRIILYILYLALVGLHAVTLREVTSVYGANINIAALMVLGVSLYKKEITAMWFGFMVGLVLSSGNPHQMGWFALMYGGLGLVSYQVRERLNLESLYAKLLLVFGGVLVVNVLTLFTSGTDGFLQRLLRVAFVGAVYTTVIGYVFFLFKEGVITYKKIKSIF